MYLPILINIKKQPVTIFGGGVVALRKTKKILDYGGSVHCISPEFIEGFEKLACVRCEKAVYEKALLPKKGLVIAATNDSRINQRILLDCESMGILCARVDCGEESDFIFSADRQTKDLIVSVSTKGESPARAKRILNEMLQQYDLNKEKMMKIRVGTRGSKLALTQTRWVIDQLSAIFPEIEFELQIIVTKGDRIQNVSIEKIGDKGAFVKEIEEALLLGRIDMAVHSMKDMPGEVTKGLMFAPSPLREAANDVVLTPHSVISILDLPKNSVIATGSKRRSYQLREIRSDIKTVDIRGNVETRIKKMLNGLDGLVLAQAGLNRLKLTESDEYRCIPLPVSSMVPAPAQGILGIQIREDDKELLRILEKIKDEITNIQLLSERSFLKGVDGGCSIPVGAYAQVEGEKLTLHGLFGTEDGKVLIRDSIVGSCENAEELGFQLAEKIKKEVDAYGR